MGIGNQILFFLAGLGVFNGFLLVFYFLFFVKSKRWVNRLFGLLLLMLCIRIGKSLFYIFIPDLDRLYRQIGLSACIMIGPLLYRYVHHLAAKSKRPDVFDKIHLLLPLFLIVMTGIIWPYERNPILWNDYLVHGIYSVWVIYMVMAASIVLPIIKKAFKLKPTIQEYWILLVYSCILLLCLAYNMALYGFPYLTGPLLFSVILYVMMAFLASKKNRSYIIEEAPAKYQNQKISEPQTNQLLLSLSDLMQSQQPYLNQKIKLADIAQSIDSTPHEVSQVINDGLGISFNQYINEYRIQAACTLLKESDHLTVEGIGHEVGFSSRSAFYTAFKAVMKQTPGQYKVVLKKEG